MKLENKYTEDEMKAINLSREMSGVEAYNNDIKDTELKDNEIEKKTQEETAEEIKKRKNENEERRLKQKGGLKPNEMFTYTLINWDGKPQTINIIYPTTKKAIRYSKMDFDPQTGRGILVFADVVSEFEKDDLLPKFDMENFPATEITDLATFLSRVVANPFFK